MVANSFAVCESLLKQIIDGLMQPVSADARDRKWLMLWFLLSINYTSSSLPNPPFPLPHIPNQPPQHPHPMPFPFSCLSRFLPQIEWHVIVWRYSVLSHVCVWSVESQCTRYVYQIWKTVGSSHITRMLPIGLYGKITFCCLKMQK